MCTHANIEIESCPKYTATLFFSFHNLLCNYTTSLLYNSLVFLRQGLTKGSILKTIIIFLVTHHLIILPMYRCCGTTAHIQWYFNVHSILYWKSDRHYLL